ncbi:CHRD domain-containing protein [Sphingorhabdus profundilacus]|nr:CHRD domain-containing protein [Sphingorhabdus profundilacus]
MNMSPKNVAIAFAIVLPSLMAGCATLEEGVVEAVAETHRASLSGREVVTSTGDRDGSAQAEVSIANTLDQICYDINKINNIADITSVSINRGLRGQTGPAVLTFSRANEGGWKNCVKRSEWLEDSLEWKPGNYYIQISTTEFPQGAIRGQLTR